MIVLSILLLLFCLNAVGGFSSSRPPALPPDTATQTPNNRAVSRAKSILYSSPPTIDSQVPDTAFILSDELKRELQSKDANEGATVYDYMHGKKNGLFESMVPLDEQELKLHNKVIEHDHFEFRSLDDLFPNLNFSEKYNSCASFRQELRHAIRHDMISDTSIYGKMTDKQKHQELIRNQPLIGYWKQEHDATTTTKKDTLTIKMKQTTIVLRQYLGTNAPIGDEFMETIGSLTNSVQEPFHWTEVVGVAATQNKKLGDKTPHGWHQDYGQLESSSRDDNDEHQGNKHVFFAFPPHDHYNGIGVFPHLIKLKYEQWAKPLDAASNRNKPTFYRGTVPEEYIVRPRYTAGREIIIFQDVDVLHSSPDIQYRESIMRFG